jgi:hypothetical protein
VVLKENAFTVDKEVKYKGTASMRFDVPELEILVEAMRVQFFLTGRNLTGYDALTFWVKRLKQLP